MPRFRNMKEKELYNQNLGQRFAEALEQVEADAAKDPFHQKCREAELRIQQRKAKEQRA